MSKQVNPAAVGIFVTGAIIILLAGVIALSSGKWFEKHDRFVIYFQSATNGLQEGSDVKLGGVKIGSVKRMQVRFDPTTREKLIRVEIELSADRLAEITTRTSFSRDNILSAQSMQRATDELGLKARLMSKSVLTGQLFVDLDFFPDDKASYYFAEAPEDDPIQIPSTKNEIERVLDTLTKAAEKISQIDVAQMISNLDSLMVNLNQSVKDLDMASISERAKNTLDKADSTMTSIKDLVNSDKLTNAITNLDAASSKLKDLMESVDKDSANAAIANANETLKQASKALREVEASANNITKLTNPDAAIVVRLNKTLIEIEDVSRAVKEFAEYLKRNPNALITGKKAP